MSPGDGNVAVPNSRRRMHITAIYTKKSLQIGFDAALNVGKERVEIVVGGTVDSFDGDAGFGVDGDDVDDALASFFGCDVEKH
jgi:hypothetical protein